MPTIGVTCNIVDGRFQVGCAYAEMVAGAGGVPIMLGCSTALVAAYLDRCDAFLLTGGDDPRTEPWGEPTHPRAKPVDPARQAFEVALLAALAGRPEIPVLGVCLGMQMMALAAGGRLDQHLPDTLATAADHWGRVAHEIRGDLGAGTVLSHHRQAVADPGRLATIARAHDGVIEAIRDPERAFYLGVQWHPERTAHAALGYDLIRSLVDAAG